MNMASFPPIIFPLDVVHAMFQSSTKCEANNEDDLSKFEHVEKTIFSGKANSDDGMFDPFHA